MNCIFKQISSNNSNSNFLPICYYFKILMDKYIIKKCIFPVNNQSTKLKFLINNALLYTFSFNTKMNSQIFFFIYNKWTPNLFSWSIAFLVSLFVATLVLLELLVSLWSMHWTDDRFSSYSALTFKWCMRQSWDKLKYYHHRHYEKLKWFPGWPGFIQLFGCFGCLSGRKLNG